jgi:hypothetical protein
MSSFYKKRQVIETGSGTGTIVTNACFKHTADHSADFRFSHCRYDRFYGTVLEWVLGRVEVIVSDIYLSTDDLNKYTDEQCFELILTHISAREMLHCINRISREASKNGVLEFKEQLRKMILE